jgi:hypothetical protein
VTAQSDTNANSSSSSSSCVHELMLRFRSVNETLALLEHMSGACDILLLSLWIYTIQDTPEQPRIQTGSWLCEFVYTYQFVGSLMHCFFCVHL